MIVHRLGAACNLTKYYTVAYEKSVLFPLSKPLLFFVVRKTGNHNF